MERYFLLIIVVVVLAAGYAAFRLWGRSNRDNDKVVQLIRFGVKKKRGLVKAKPKKQLCSSCRKPASKLSFYADEVGKVIGTCRECKQAAERRKLHRL